MPVGSWTLHVFSVCVRACVIASMYVGELVVVQIMVDSLIP